MLRDQWHKPSRATGHRFAVQVDLDRRLRCGLHAAKHARQRCRGAGGAEHVRECCDQRVHRNLSFMGPHNGVAQDRLATTRNCHCLAETLSVAPHRQGKQASPVESLRFQLGKQGSNFSTSKRRVPSPQTRHMPRHDRRLRPDFLTGSHANNNIPVPNVKFMGCNLRDITSPETIDLNSLAGKRVGVDAFLNGLPISHHDARPITTRGRWTASGRKRQSCLASHGLPEPNHDPVWLPESNQSTCLTEPHQN